MVPRDGDVEVVLRIKAGGRGVRGRAALAALLGRVELLGPFKDPVSGVSVSRQRVGFACFVRRSRTERMPTSRRRICLSSGVASSCVL